MLRNLISLDDFESSTISIQLRANDFDWSKYVNNSIYMQFFEQGRWDWVMKNKLDIVHSDLVGVVAKITISYIRPIYWDPVKSMMVETTICKINHFSITLSQKIYDNSDLFTTSEVQLSLFDTKEKRVEKISAILEKI